MLSFSDKELDLKDFCRSLSQPMAQDYNFIGKNPILSCLLDQIKQGPEMSEKYGNQETLLKDIIEGLEGNKIFLPNEFTLISSEEWIRKMSLNPNFYLHHVDSSSELQEYENFLLYLAAQCLEREINLIPILEQGQQFTFTPDAKILTKSFSISKINNMYNQPQFYLLSCQKLWHQNFFLSVYKKSAFGEL